MQKLPLSSGTVHVETPTGAASSVASNIRIICRVSWHSFGVVSPITARKSRFTRAFLFGELGELHLQHREDVVGAHVRRGKSTFETIG